MPNSYVERIAVLGTGYVGLTTACGLANVGHHVVGYDIDPDKVARMSDGQCPFYEAGLGELLRENLLHGRLRFTTDLADCLACCEILMVCVPTLSRDDGQADTSIVESVAESVARGTKSPPADHPGRWLVIVKSTVPPGTTERLADRFESARLEFAVNPEFLKEGSAVDDFQRPDRVVVGVARPETGERLQRLYAPFVRNEHPILVTSRTAAETIKYAANIMLAGRISLINELANICKLIGVDVNEVRRGVGYDRRIGFDFLYPGIGFGGSCLPKDLDAMIQLANKLGYEAELLEAIAHVNREQQTRLVDVVTERLGGDVNGRTIAVWGLSYKPGTDDIRQAPALSIVDELLAGGACLQVHDPVANNAVRAVFGNRLTYFDEQYDALNGAEAMILCTEWSPFRKPDFTRMKSALARPLILDGRNLYDPALMRELGFEYCSVGRPDPSAEPTT